LTVSRLGAILLCMSIIQTLERIRTFRQQKGWTLSKFAREAELRESTIRKMDEPGWNPEIKTLAKLEEEQGA
jgi:ribosome-binding protein aMBF1 (putative translation factor)